jgi:hypothetical protein
MPCYDPRDNSPDIWGQPQPCSPTKLNFKKYGLSAIDADIPGLLMELTCQACTLLEANGYFDASGYGKSSHVSKELYEWWENHKKRDAEQLEQFKKRALAKLTHKEKIALGLAEA